MPGLLIYNAASGTAAKFPPQQLAESLRAGGEEVRLHEFTEGDDPAKLTSDAIANGITWVAVAGGDGTVEAAAKALVGTDIPLGVIPCGTYNNFALSASIPLDPLQACAMVVAGRTRLVDVGLINGTPFFECVGVGLDAALFTLGEEVKSGAVFKTWDFFRRAARYPLHRFEIELDRPFGEALVSTPGNASERRLQRAFSSVRERKLSVRAWMITVSNGPYYGMNFAVAPDARIDDAVLTVAIFKRFSKLRLWWHFYSIRAGRKTPSPRLITLRATQIRISHQQAQHVHADGQPVNQWPIEISLRQRGLRLFTLAAQSQKP